MFGPRFSHAISCAIGRVEGPTLENLKVVEARGRVHDSHQMQKVNATQVLRLSAHLKKQLRHNHFAQLGASLWVKVEARHTGSRSARLCSSRPLGRQSTCGRVSCSCLSPSLSSRTGTVPLPSVSNTSKIDLIRITSDLTYLRYIGARPERGESRVSAHSQAQGALFVRRAMLIPPNASSPGSHRLFVLDPSIAPLLWQGCSKIVRLKEQTGGKASWCVQ